MARKIKAVALAAVGTDADDVLIGSNNSLLPDTLDGGAGNDYLDSLQGADTLIGGSGDDIFKVHSWASSNVTYGVDQIQDLEAGDKIDLTNIQHYSDADMSIAVSRAVNFSDVTVTGNTIHVEVVAGDPRWDIDIEYLGVAPTEANFVFA